MKDFDLDSLKKVSHKIVNDAVDKAREDRAKELPVLDIRDVFGREFKIYGDVENPIFLAGDIAEAIDHSDVPKMMLSVNNDEKFIRKIYITSDQSEANEDVDDKLKGTLFPSGQFRDMWFLTENGVLELLTKSRKLKAKQLKLTIEEVLKDIRDKAKTALNEGFQAFYNSEFGEIRMAVIDGKPYAVGIDVAKVLEYAKPEKAISDHCGYPLKWGVTDSLGRTRSTMMISEGDIYRLIIAAANQSLNPEIKVKAKEFEKWVFDEVLPEIRKNGYYMTNAKVAEVTSNPDAFIKELEDKNAKLVADLEAERAENRQLIEDNEYLQLAIEENEYKVTFADAVAVSEGCMLIREAAKVLNNNDIDIGPNQLSEILRNKSLLIRKKGSDYNTPTRKAMKLGLFKLKLSTVNGELKRTPYLTPKGLIYVTNNLYDWSKWSNES